ncbi:MAG: energy transducer TonB [Syntrophobacteraceae bacterium]|nr:energy transducer TonB [Syntrophobacteraceae bacterium]
MCGIDDALALLTFCEEGRPGAPNPVGDVEVCEWGFGGVRSPRAYSGESALGWGLAIFFHLLVAAVVVLSGFFFAVPSVSRQPFVTISLVTLAGAGEGAGGFPGAAGSPGPVAPGGGGEIALPNPPKTGASVERLAKAEVRKKSALPAKPVEPFPKRQPAASRSLREKAVRAPDCTKQYSKPQPHREAPPVDARPAGSGPASGAGSSGNGGGVGSFSGAGSGGGGGGGGGGLGHGTGGSGGFGLKQVDIAPIPIKKVEPEFPDQARQMGISGKVVLRFLVGSDGRVARASVISARPVGVFNRSALEAIGEWRFKPGRYQGKPVAVWVELPVCFRLSR